ncbi:MAG: hypothetical protein H6Q30_494 [Bacteroidetes bacterium]|nr:hypothetical protein [Bacteroidota bacterium]
MSVRTQEPAGTDLERQVFEGPRRALGCFLGVEPPLSTRVHVCPPPKAERRRVLQPHFPCLISRIVAFPSATPGPRNSSYREPSACSSGPTPGQRPANRPAGGAGAIVLRMPAGPSHTGGMPPPITAIKRSGRCPVLHAGSRAVPSKIPRPPG